jgi:uncharacterized iron-regulated protein
MGKIRSLSLLPIAVALTLVAGCSASMRVEGPAGVWGIDGSRWRSTLSQEHPLVGRIHDVSGDREIKAAQLVEALEDAEIVLLGEQHDNADHHVLQALLLQDLVAAGRRPSVAFEQLDVDKQATVDAALATPGGVGGTPVTATATARATVTARATALADAVAWNKSGWPPFDDYRPVFEVALARDLPIRAANLSRAAMEPMFAPTNAKHAAVGAVAAPYDVALSAEAAASLAADITESHCGYADERMVAMMTAAQQRRDQAMAGVALDAVAQSPSRGAVLICGFGHARTDYGVPVHLQGRQPGHREAGRRVVSVALLEVIPGFDSPSDYAAALHTSRLPFDYVIFTPRVDAEDPCEKFRAGLEKMKVR